MTTCKAARIQRRQALRKPWEIIKSVNYYHLTEEEAEHRDAPKLLMELRERPKYRLFELFQTPRTKIILLHYKWHSFCLPEVELLCKAVFLKEEMVTHFAPGNAIFNFWVSNSNILNKLPKIPLWLPIVLRVGSKWWASPYLWLHSHLQPSTLPLSSTSCTLLYSAGILTYFQFTQWATFLPSGGLTCDIILSTLLFLEKLSSSFSYWMSSYVLSPLRTFLWPPKYL